MYEGYDEHQISFTQDLPKFSELTKEEIRFLRQIFHELKIEPELGEVISLYTDITNFSQFLVYILRKFNTFQNDRLNHLLP